jgi:hypothetical protein
VRAEALEGGGMEVTVSLPAAQPTQAAAGSGNASGGAA